MSTIVNTSAGVYVSTLDRSQSISAKKQVSIGAIVLFANQGPVDQMVKITKGQDEFIEIFGNPDHTLGYGHYCALTALRKMSELYVTRVHNDARFGGLKVYIPTTGTKLEMKQFNAPKCVDPYDPNKFYLDEASGFFNDATDLFYIYGIYPSTLSSKYRVSCDLYKDGNDPARPNTFQIMVWSSASSRIPLETWTVSRDHQIDGYGRQQFLESVINGRSKYIRVLNNPFNTTAMSNAIYPKGNVLIPAVPAHPAVVARASRAVGTYGSLDPGYAGCLAYLEDEAHPLIPGEAVRPAGTYGVSDPGLATAIVEIPAIGAKADAIYGPNGPVQYLTVEGTVLDQTFAYLSAGHNGNTDSVGSTLAIPSNLIPLIYTGEMNTFPSDILDPPIEYKRSGWTLYRDREEVNFDLMINGGITIPSVQDKMVEIADIRGDVFVILDIPLDAQGNRYSPTAAAINYRNDPLALGGTGNYGIDSANAAIYTPWVETLDKYTGRNVIVPPSGHIAAIYCATDIDYATWFAPAGIKRGLFENIDPNFAQTMMTYHQSDRDELHFNQVNCTRIIPSIGTALWDACTLQKKDTALSNVNVVRLLKYCTRNINSQLLYNVFDPNDPFLRTELVHRLTAILEPIKLNRGLYAYLVVCTGPEEENSNNSYEDISAGIVNVDVYLEPTIPAKRIYVKLIVNNAGALLGPIKAI